MHLADTHVLLWTLADDPRLGPRTRVSMQRSTVHASSVSVLEIRIKQQLGKLVVPDDLTTRLTEAGFHLLDFSADDADGLAPDAALARHDPFDRALLAQARARRLGFLTADARLLSLGLDGVDDATR